MPKTVPIMFHSVGLGKHRWRSSHISQPIDEFEAQMAILAKNGYTSLFFNDYVPGKQHNPRQVVLTFDDGYLDNWVHVFPIIRQYGLKGTVFVNPEFVDPREIVRPQAEPGQDTSSHKPDDCCAGFLSWPEIQEMEKSGLVDIQSHSLTHTWYFKGPKVVDFWHPGAATESGGPIWMLWNRFLDFKPFYLTQASDYESKIPYGTPIYEFGKSLETRRYFPCSKLDELLPKYVEDHGGIEFFRQQDWQQRLQEVVNQNTDTDKDTGQYEAQDEYLDRVRYELAETKKILEQKLNKTIEAVCWPGGGVTDDAINIAKDLGYKRFTLPSSLASAQTAGQYSDFTRRVGHASHLVYRGRDLGRITAREFLWRVKREEGSSIHMWLRRFAIILRLAADKFYFMRVPSTDD